MLHYLAFRAAHPPLWGSRAHGPKIPSAPFPAMGLYIFALCASY